MTRPDDLDSFLALAARVARGDAAAASDLGQAAAALGPDAKALADSLAGIARERAELSSRLAQAAKLSEVGLAFAELVHELRQPLSAISGVAQLAAPERSAPDLAHDVLGHVDRMEGMLERLRRFLSFTEPEVADIDPAVVVREAVALMPRPSPGVRLSVELPTLPRVHADAQLLAQVVMNLLANARDAMEGIEGLITVRGRPIAGGVEILVLDQGPGIDAAMAGRLFEPFATSKGARGTGLGLYVAREIVRAWDGSLARVEPPAPFRTAFCVRLAGARPAPEEASGSFAALKDELAARVGRIDARPTLLLAHHDAAVRRMWRVVVAAPLGLEPTEAADGPAAALALRPGGLQLLVAEKDLPGVDGLGLLQRAAERSVMAEAILATDRPSVASASAAMENGAAYVVMPADAEALRAKAAAAARRLTLRALASGLGSELRPWAVRAKAELARGGAGPVGARFGQALERLASRPEGPAAVLVVGEEALVQLVTAAGHDARGPVKAEAAAAAVGDREHDVVIVGLGTAQADAVAITRAATSLPWPTEVLWAIPVEEFSVAHAASEAGATGVIPRTVDPRVLMSLLSKRVRARREAVLWRALGEVLAGLGIQVGPD